MSNAEGRDNWEEKAADEICVKNYRTFHSQNRSLLHSEVAELILKHAKPAMMEVGKRGFLESYYLQGGSCKVDAESIGELAWQKSETRKGLEGEV